LEKNQNDLDIIQPLWEKLHAHHWRSPNISRQPRNDNVRTRKKMLIEKSFEGALRIDLARDAVTKEFIGYCVPA